MFTPINNNVLQSFLVSPISIAIELIILSIGNNIASNEQKFWIDVVKKYLKEKEKLYIHTIKIILKTKNEDIP